jgi:hypothetical protein
MQIWCAVLQSRHAFSRSTLQFSVLSSNMVNIRQLNEHAIAKQAEEAAGNGDDDYAAATVKLAASKAAATQLQLDLSASKSAAVVRSAKAAEKALTAAAADAAKKRASVEAKLEELLALNDTSALAAEHAAAMVAQQNSYAVSNGTCLLFLMRRHCAALLKLRKRNVNSIRCSYNVQRFSSCCSKLRSVIMQRLLADEDEKSRCGGARCGGGGNGAHQRCKTTERF